MEKNKVVLWIYTVFAIAVGLTLLINGLIYVFNYFIDDETAILALVLSMTVGMIEAMIGGILLKNGIDNVGLLIIKHEEDKQNNKQPNDNNVTKNTNIKSNKNPDRIFFTINLTCLFTFIVFMIAQIYFVYINDTWEELYILIPYFTAFLIIFLVGQIVFDKIKKKKNISDIKKSLGNELIFKIGGIYCLIINIIYFFDIPTLVCFSIILALELVRLAFVIRSLTQKTLGDEIITVEPTSNDLAIDDRFIDDKGDIDIPKD